jgi:hypothetical protein
MALYDRTKFMFEKTNELVTNEIKTMLLLDFILTDLIFTFCVM